MRALLVGGHGFLGTHLARELRSRGHVVIQFGGPATGDEFLPPAIPHLLGWPLLTDLMAQAEVVVMLAAQVGRAFGEDDPIYTVEQNVLLPMNVARALKALDDELVEHPPRRLVYVSTSEAYGDRGLAVAREDAWHLRATPHNLYGLTKRQGEEVSALYMPNGGLQVVRPSMPYGPGLPHGQGRAAIINMLWQADTGQDIVVHAGAERSWCYVDDAVRGFAAVLERGDVALSADDYDDGIGCYNVGRDDDPVRMLDVARAAIQIVAENPNGKPPATSRIVEVDPPARQTIVKRLATEELRSLGWRPEVDLHEGMTRTLLAARGAWS